MEKTILFQTLTGSRLYGLAHEDSDYDWYTVVDKVRSNKARYATHKIIGDKDSTVVDFGTWMLMADKGVPQALEAMYSSMPVIDEITAFRAGYRAGRQAEATYLRTIKAMAKGQDDFKHRRHVMRLGWNLGELASTGRIWPTLTPETVDLINWYAKNMDMDACYKFAKRVAFALDGVVH